MMSRWGDVYQPGTRTMVTVYQPSTVTMVTDWDEEDVFLLSVNSTK